MKTEKSDNGQRTTDNGGRLASRSVVRSQWSVVNPLRSPKSPTLVVASVILGVFLFNVALAVDGDIVFKRQGGEGGVPVAVFPHWFHRIRFKCYACHPSIFEMKAGADKITMDAIGNGKFCGACHDGKVAWPVSFDTCSRCHVGK